MQKASNLPRLALLSLRENAFPIVLIAIYIGIAFALSRHFGFGLRIDPKVGLILFAACYILLASASLLWLFITERPVSPLRAVASLPQRWRLDERMVVGAPMLLALACFFPVFGSMKSAIPAMRHYTFDPLLSHLDVMIHGRPAWEMLQPLLGYPVVSYLLNCVYHLWIGALYLSVAAMAVSVQRPELRARFLIAFLLSWMLLGNLLATLLASVGPCFYGFFYPDDPYVPLMGYLREADKVFSLGVLDVQAILIEWWRTGTPGLGRGISAMPSVHVSLACLLMLLSWHFGRAWAVAGTLFLVVIFLGSIHLGYHYAVDGYVSLIGTPVIWWASKHLAAIRFGFPWRKQSFQAAE